MTITLPPDLEKAVIEKAARENKMPEQVALEQIRPELENYRLPQTLDEIQPRKTPPPGKTLKDMIENLPRPDWSEEETDEKLLAALKALDKEP